MRCASRSPLIRSSRSARQTSVRRDTACMWKRCPRCCRLLPIEKFDRRSPSKQRLRAYCRSCHDSYIRDYYRTHVAQYSAHRLRNVRRYRLRNQRLCDAYLSSHPCIDCGETDHVVLEFDHVRGLKRENVAQMVRDGVAWRMVEEEIAKCEVRCANCHRRRTALQLRWKAGAREYEIE
jgi:hypothetical protein